MRYTPLCKTKGLGDSEATARNLRTRKGLYVSLCPKLCQPPLVQVEYNDEGISALIFTSEGDMRQAINNLQSTWSGFGFVSSANVFKVCDQPHPIAAQAIISACQKGDIDGSLDKLNDLWCQCYIAIDIITTIFRVVKTFDEYV